MVSYRCWGCGDVNPTGILYCEWCKPSRRAYKHANENYNSNFNAYSIAPDLQRLTKVDLRTIEVASGREIPWKCKDCGAEWVARVRNMTGHGVRPVNKLYHKCGGSKPVETKVELSMRTDSEGSEELKSGFEMAIHDVLRELGLGSKDLQCNQKMKVGGAEFEIDFVVVKRNLCIEVNGLWPHSIDAGKPKEYHTKKSALVRELGYDLYTVWEDDWKSRKPQVIADFKNVLGVQEGSYSKTENTVRELDTSEALRYIETHCIETHRKTTSTSLGVFDKDGKQIGILEMMKRKGVIILHRYHSQCHPVEMLQHILNWMETEGLMTAKWLQMDVENDNSWLGKVLEKAGFIPGKHQREFIRNRSSRGRVFERVRDRRFTAIPGENLVWNAGYRTYIYFC